MPLLAPTSWQRWSVTATPSAVYLSHTSPALDDAPTPGPVGVLPLLTTILAEAYELAVHALDLRDAGAADPPPALLDAGLAALAEVTGALAAAHGVSGGRPS